MPNQCDKLCPLTTLRNAEWKQQSEGLGPIAKAQLAITLAALGVGHVVHAAAICPMRNRSPALWEATPGCVEGTRNLLAQEAVDPAKFDAREHQILDPYVPQPPAPEAPPPTPPQ